MSNHLLWVEVRDRVEQNALHRAYSFFGHPSMASSCFAPEMESAHILAPHGEKIELELERGEWMPGYGYAEHLFTEVMCSWPGDYIFSAVRSPGVYNLSWHGRRDEQFLSHNFAKAIIHAGDDSEAIARIWESGLPLELIPQSVPYDLKTGDDLRIMVRYLHQPVTASYSASHWTWEENGDLRVKRGQTDENGMFTVNLSQGGLWLIDAEHTLPEPGSWMATHSLDPFFKSGDCLNYNSRRYKTTLSLWVR